MDKIKQLNLADKILNLSAQGYGAVRVSEILASQGFVISHMTIHRFLKDQENIGKLEEIKRMREEANRPAQPLRITSDEEVKNLINPYVTAGQLNIVEAELLRREAVSLEALGVPAHKTIKRVVEIKLEDDIEIMSAISFYNSERGKNSRRCEVKYSGIF